MGGRREDRGGERKGKMRRAGAVEGARGVGVESVGVAAVQEGRGRGGKWGVELQPVCLMPEFSTKAKRRGETVSPIFASPPLHHRHAESIAPPSTLSALIGHCAPLHTP